MNEKEIIKFVRKNIRSLDAVNSTATHIVSWSEDKQESSDEDLIEEDTEDSDRRSQNLFFISDRG